MITKFHIWQFFDKCKNQKNHIFIIGGIFMLTFAVGLGQKFIKEEPHTPSLDEFIPNNFVLVSIKIVNSSDILALIGDYGVVDLYSYTDETQQAGQQVAKALKVVPTKSEDMHFAAIVPEKDIRYLLEYKGPFYAVVQNPKKQSSQILKKRVKPQLKIIEESIYD